MTSREEAEYRLNLARGYLAEAEEDVGLKRWRSCADNAQLAIENAAKAIIACFEPVSHTHDPGPYLQTIVALEEVPEDLAGQIEGIISVVTSFGSQEHILFSYGDEEAFRDPWSIVTEGKAVEVIDGARRCFTVAQAAYDRFFGLEK